MPEPFDPDDHDRPTLWDPRWEDERYELTPSDILARTAHAAGADPRPYVIRWARALLPGLESRTDHSPVPGRLVAATEAWAAGRALAPVALVQELDALASPYYRQNIRWDGKPYIHLLKMAAKWDPDDWDAGYGLEFVDFAVALLDVELIGYGQTAWLEVLTVLYPDDTEQALGAAATLRNGFDGTLDEMVAMGRRLAAEPDRR